MEEVTAAAVVKREVIITKLVEGIDTIIRPAAAVVDIVTNTNTITTIIIVITMTTDLNITNICYENKIICKNTDIIRRLTQLHFQENVHQLLVVSILLLHPMATAIRVKYVASVVV